MEILVVTLQVINSNFVQLWCFFVWPGESSTTGWILLRNIIVTGCACHLHSYNKHRNKEKVSFLLLIFHLFPLTSSCVCVWFLSLAAKHEVQEHLKEMASNQQNLKIDTL